MKRARDAAPPSPAPTPASRPRNVIRVTQRGAVAAYVKYGLRIVPDSPVIVTSDVKASYKAVTVAEMMKKELPALFQVRGVGRFGCGPRT